MEFKIDLHVHTRMSGDTDSDPEECIRMAIDAGLHGIAFTEHYSYAASGYAGTLREKYQDAIMIFRGVEFSCAEGHCLVFGVDTDLFAEKYAPVQEIVTIANEHGGVVIPSHPFRGQNSIGAQIASIEGFCAIEGYNGNNLDIYNKKAVEASQSLLIPHIGGSDAHLPKEVGSCYTVFYDEVRHDNFIELLKAGRYHGVDTRKISRGITKFLRGL